jgi:hypothetical protein
MIEGFGIDGFKIKGLRIQETMIDGFVTGRSMIERTTIERTMIEEIIDGIEIEKLPIRQKPEGCQRACDHKVGIIKHECLPVQSISAIELLNAFMLPTNAKQLQPNNCSIVSAVRVRRHRRLIVKAAVELSKKVALSLFLQTQGATRCARE